MKPYIFFVLCGFIINCAHIPTLNKKDPNSYLQQALYYKNQGNYTEALNRLNQFQKQFSYNIYSQKALLIKGDVYFEQGAYELAASTYNQHLKLYPGINTARILYQIGLAYKAQLPAKDDQDISFAKPALQAFRKLLDLKKTSKYTKQALKELQELQNRQVRKSFKQALFYKSQKWNQAAFKRLQFLLKTQANSPIRPQILLEAYMLAKDTGHDSEIFKQELKSRYPVSKSRQSLLKKTSRFFFN